jgi:hypothetical protein
VSGDKARGGVNLTIHIHLVWNAWSFTTAILRSFMAWCLDTWDASPQKYDFSRILIAPVRSLIPSSPPLLKAMCFRLRAYPVRPSVLPYVILKDTPAVLSGPVALTFWTDVPQKHLAINGYRVVRVRVSFHTLDGPTAHLDGHSAEICVCVEITCDESSFLLSGE